MMRLVKAIAGDNVGRMGIEIDAFDGHFVIEDEHGQFCTPMTNCITIWRNLIVEDMAN